jgi:phosphoinositide-3-kinase regulatory subunit 4
MGNQLASQTAQLDYYLHDLPGIVYETSLGKGRFLKTLQCIHDEGTVVVKVYIKRDSSQSLKEQIEKLTGKDQVLLVDKTQQNIMFCHLT